MKGHQKRRGEGKKRKEKEGKQWRNNFVEKRHKEKRDTTNIKRENFDTPE